MEHSLQAYLERRTTEELKQFLEECTCSGKSEEYKAAICLVLQILKKRSRLENA